MNQISWELRTLVKSYEHAFLILFLQIKYATPDNPNNIGLTFSPKNQLPWFG